MSGPRTRTRGGLSPLTQTTTYKYGNNPLVTSGSVCGYSGQSESMTDYVTSGFSSRRKAGEVFSSPMRKLKVNRDSTMGSASHFHIIDSGPLRETYTFSNYVNRNFGQIRCKDLISTGDILSMVTQVSTAAMGKVAPPTIQGLVTLGELRETIHMLRNPFQNFNKFLGEVKRSARYKRWRASRQAGNLSEFLQAEWMRYRYGVRPFISELQAGLSAVEAILARGEKPRYTARSKTEVSQSTVEQPTLTDGTYNVQTRASFSHKVNVRAGVLYDWDLEYQNTGAILGLRLSDVPSALWELTTLSFVFDWFANIGDYIAAITPVAGVTRLAEWYTVTEELSAFRTAANPSLTTAALSGGWQLAYASGGSDYETIVRSHRECVLPVGLTLKPFALARVSSDARLIDSIILAKQLLFRG